MSAHKRLRPRSASHDLSTAGGLRFPAVFSGCRFAMVDDGEDDLDDDDAVDADDQEGSDEHGMYPYSCIL